MEDIYAIDLFLYIFNCIEEGSKINIVAKTPLLPDSQNFSDPGLRKT